MAAGTAAVIGKAAAAVLSNERTRKALGWVIAAILSPLILIMVIILALLSGTTQHNNSAVDLVFNGGVFSSSMDADYANHIRAMQSCLVTLDYAIAAVNAETEGGALDSAMVKSVFYSLCFGNTNLTLSTGEAGAFVNCFVRYETRTREVTSDPDPGTGEVETTTEEYTVAVPVSTWEAHNNLAAIGYPVTSELSDNARAVYIRIAYGNGGSYSGSIEYGGARMTELDVSRFTDLGTKNAADLATYAIHAWESGWGYVWGTFGDVLTESLLEYKIDQYPDGVGNRESIIREKWLDGRTADCVGLIKGYGWLDPVSLTISYGTNDMQDVTADGMYNAASVKGSISTMPDIPGLAVWHAGHIGVYIGNGEVIEAMGTSYGVVKTQLWERNWTAWLEVPYINYD